VGNGDGESKTVAELALESGFPSAGTAAVAAASIGEDEQLPAGMVAARAVAPPPTGHGVGGEGCGVMRDAHENRASVGEQVINTIRGRDADSIGTEIVIIDAHGVRSHLTPLFLKLPTSSRFGIDADNGKPQPRHGIG